MLEQLKINRKASRKAEGNRGKHIIDPYIDIISYDASQMHMHKPYHNVQGPSIHTYAYTTRPCEQCVLQIRLLKND